MNSRTLELVTKVPEVRAAIERPKGDILAIGVPSPDYVNANFSMALAQLMYRLGARHQRVACISTKGSNIARNRNKIVDQAIHFGCSKLLFIDADMSFPAQAAERLLSHGKAIVGATYAQRSGLHKSHAVLTADTPQDIRVNDLTEVQALPTGMLLIDLAVFKDLKRPYFRFPTDEASGEVLGEDYTFCEMARAAGHQVWLDPQLSFDIIHWGEVGWRLDPDLCGRSPNEPDAQLVQLEDLKV